MIKIFDTTLRDGAQAEGISYSVSDKLAISASLDSFGVSYIEGGTPFSNDKDAEFFSKVASLGLKKAKICAFGRTRHKNVKAESDIELNLLAEVSADVIVLCGKAWDKQITNVLCTTAEENLNIISDSIKFLKSHSKEVIFDAEHFYDGYASDKEYAYSVLKAAFDAGADAVCLCDTRGGTVPETIYEITKNVVSDFSSFKIGIHLHNDIGCAVASACICAKLPIDHIQGSFNGFGERCGNTELSTVIPNLKLKYGIECDGDVSKLTLTSKQIAEISNIQLDRKKPYVGKSAFAHKGGMHTDAMTKDSSSFEHIDPTVVGNSTRILISEVAGRSALISKISSYAPIERDSDEAVKILGKIKKMECDGYQFEAADASLELLVRHDIGDLKRPFNINFYKTTDDYPAPDFEESSMRAAAMIEVEVNGECEVTASVGNGPVNALDLALRKALSVFYPFISEMHLTDYKVRVLEGNKTTNSKTRVLIESRDNDSSWTTIGVSHDVIEASFIALLDSFEYKILTHSQKGK